MKLKTRGCNQILYWTHAYSGTASRLSAMPPRLLRLCIIPLGFTLGCIVEVGDEEFRSPCETLHCPLWRHQSRNPHPARPQGRSLTHTKKTWRRPSRCVPRPIWRPSRSAAKALQVVGRRGTRQCRDHGDCPMTRVGGHWSEWEQWLQSSKDSQNHPFAFTPSCLRAWIREMRICNTKLW